VGDRCQRSNPESVDYEPLVVAYKNGAAVHIRDVGQAVDSVQDLRRRVI